jgi:hypothetical protein
MKISEQLIQLSEMLSAWTKENGGAAAVARDPYHRATLLAATPAGARALIMFHGETKRGDYEEMGAVDRTFWVVITRGQGLRLSPGANLVEGNAGGKALFDLVEEARQLVRGISFAADTTEVTPNFKSIEPFNVEGYLLDAYKLEFSIGVQLPAPLLPETNE